MKVKVLFILFGLCLFIACNVEDQDSDPTPDSTPASTPEAPTPEETIESTAEPAPEPALVIYGPINGCPANPTITSNVPDDGITTEAIQAGRAGGIILNYSDFNMTAVESVWAGFAHGDAEYDHYTPLLGLDGSYDNDPEDLMVFNPDSSNLEGGIAVWESTQELRYYYNDDLISTNCPVRVTVTVSGEGIESGFIPAETIQETFETFDTSISVLAPVTGNFSANIIYEINFQDTWYPVLDFFDDLENHPDDAVAVSYWFSLAWSVIE